VNRGERRKRSRASQIVTSVAGSFAIGASAAAKSVAPKTSIVRGGANRADVHRQLRAECGAVDAVPPQRRDPLVEAAPGRPPRRDRRANSEPSEPITLVSDDRKPRARAVRRRSAWRARRCGPSDAASSAASSAAADSSASSLTNTVQRAPARQANGDGQLVGDAVRDEPRRLAGEHGFGFLDDGRSRRSRR